MVEGVKINPPMAASSNPKKQGKIWLIISLGAIILFLAGTGIGYWQLTKSFNKQKADLQKQIEDLNKKLNAAKKTETTETSQSETTEAFDYAGWHTYVNDVYKYQFKYPDGTNVTEAQKVDFSMTPEEAAQGLTFDQLYDQLTGKICLWISYNSASIYISAPANKEFSRVICGRTGIDSDTQLTPAERTLTINGQNHTAQGDKSNNNIYNLVVELTDGTRIEYSTDANNVDLLTTIERIIESYQPI